MKKGKKIKRIVAMILCIGILLTGCSQNKLSDKYKEETVKAEAERAIAYFNEQDYKGILEMGSEELKASITAEQFAEVSDPYLEKCGTFQEISKTVIVGNTNPETKEDYAVVVMIGTYEEGRIQFSMAFNEAMELIQFLIE